MKNIFKKEKNNNLDKIQKILLNQIERLDDEEVMKERGRREIMRSGAISQNAISFMKTIQIQMKVLEISNKHNIKIETLNNYLGIENEKENK